MHEISRLSDKQAHYIRNQAYKTRQVCLYRPSPDSILYQEMLTFKATQSAPHTASELRALESDSDSEYGGGEQYDGDAESTYFTEEEWRENSSSPFQILNGKDEDVIESEADSFLDDVEVGYYSTRSASSPSVDVPKSELAYRQLLLVIYLYATCMHMCTCNLCMLLGEMLPIRFVFFVHIIIQSFFFPVTVDSRDVQPSTQPKLGHSKSMVTIETNSSPSLDIHPKSLSFENLSLTETDHSGVHFGEQSSTAYVTSTEYLTAHQFDTDTDHTDTDTDTGRHR